MRFPPLVAKFLGAVGIKSTAKSQDAAPAQTRPEKAPEPKLSTAVPDAGLAAGLAKTAKVDKVEIQKAASADDIAQTQAAKDKSVTEVFVKPTSRTSTTVTFKMPDYGGKEIGPNERWLMQVPAEFRSTPIRTVILVHRKERSTHGASVEQKNGKDWDNQGAYNLVTARKTGTDSWVTWSDQYGSKKFAEPRPSGDPEHENLHDWLAAVGSQNVDLLAVTGSGKGEHAIANVHEVVIEFFPPGKIDKYQEEIFSPGTAFVDPSKGIKKPKYGGGMGGHVSQEVLATKGMYPDAVEIGGYGGGGDKHKSEKSYVDSSGRLHIKLEPGKVFGGFECSCGDTAFDKNKPAEQQRNKDGHYGRLGWGKLYARVQNSQTSGPSTRTPYFMERVNVPPSGVLSGGPPQAGYVAKEGDEIVVESQGHKSWIMGYRISYMDPKSLPSE